MSKFISGNIGIIRKSDVFNLKVVKEKGFSNNDVYKIVAVTYYQEGKRLVVTLDFRNTFDDIFDSFERMKKELEDIEE